MGKISFGIMLCIVYGVASLGCIATEPDLAIYLDMFDDGEEKRVTGDPPMAPFGNILFCEEPEREEDRLCDGYPNSWGEIVRAPFANEAGQRDTLNTLLYSDDSSDLGDAPLVPVPEDENEIRLGDFYSNPCATAIVEECARRVCGIVLDAGALAEHIENFANGCGIDYCGFEIETERVEDPGNPRGGWINWWLRDNPFLQGRCVGYAGNFYDDVWACARGFMPSLPLAEVPEEQNGIPALPIQVKRWATEDGDNILEDWEECGFAANYTFEWTRNVEVSGVSLQRAESGEVCEEYVTEDDYSHHWCYQCEMIQREGALLDYSTPGWRRNFTTKYTPSIVENTVDVPEKPCEEEAAEAAWRQGIQRCALEPFLDYREPNSNLQPVNRAFEDRDIDHRPGRWIAMNMAGNLQYNLNEMPLRGLRRWVFQSTDEDEEGIANPPGPPPKALETVVFADCLAKQTRDYLSWNIEYRERPERECVQIIEPYGDPVLSPNPTNEWTYGETDLRNLDTEFIVEIPIRITNIPDNFVDLAGNQRIFCSVHDVSPNGQFVLEGTNQRVQQGYSRVRWGRVEERNLREQCIIEPENRNLINANGEEFSQLNLTFMGLPEHLDGFGKKKIEICFYEDDQFIREPCNCVDVDVELFWPVFRLSAQQLAAQDRINPDATDPFLHAGNYRDQNPQGLEAFEILWDGINEYTPRAGTIPFDFEERYDFRNYYDRDANGVFIRFRLHDEPEPPLWVKYYFSEVKNQLPQAVESIFADEELFSEALRIANLSNFPGVFSEQMKQETFYNSYQVQDIDRWGRGEKVLGVNYPTTGEQFNNAFALRIPIYVGRVLLTHYAPFNISRSPLSSSGIQEMWLTTIHEWGHVAQYILYNMETRNLAIGVGQQWEQFMWNAITSVDIPSFNAFNDLNGDGEMTESFDEEWLSCDLNLDGFHGFSNQNPQRNLNPYDAIPFDAPIRENQVLAGCPLIDCDQGCQYRRCNQDVDCVTDEGVQFVCLEDREAVALCREPKELLEERFPHLDAIPEVENLDYDHDVIPNTLDLFPLGMGEVDGSHEPIRRLENSVRQAFQESDFSNLDWGDPGLNHRTRGNSLD